MNRMEDMQDKWKEIIDNYKINDQEAVRTASESLLPKETRKILDDFIDFTSEKESRTCHKNCGNVSLGSKCEEWFDEIEEIWKTLPQEKESQKQVAVALFFAMHASAYERWEDSFDYDCIGCRIHFARQISLKTADLFDGEEKAIIAVLYHLSRAVHHMAFRENGMIANNPKIMEFHCYETMKEYEEILKNLNNSNNFKGWLKVLVDGFIPFAEMNIELNRKTGEIAHMIVLAQENRKLFAEEFPKVRQVFLDYITGLEQKNYYQFASELRAYVKILDRHFNFILEPEIYLEKVIGALDFGFYAEIKDINLNIAGKGRSKAEILEDLKLEGFSDNKIEDFPIPISAVSNDPPPDILESSIGEVHFDNILINLQDIEIRNMPAEGEEEGELIFTLSPKILHYALGVGCIQYEFEIDKMTISQFQILKTIASPHSAEFQIKWNNCIWPRLGELTESIMNAYIKRLTKVLNKIDINTPDKDLEITEIANWADPTQAWFTNIYIYKIYNEKSQIVDYDFISKHWQCPGLLAYQRADRASVDDWVGVCYDKIDLNNMAQIRAHSGDIFILSGNHSISYFPDDPFFITRQYMETAKWTFLIRTLVNYCLTSSDQIIFHLQDTIERTNIIFKDEKLKENEAILDIITDKIELNKEELRNYGILAESVVDHVASAGVSQYADHSKLLYRAFHETGTHELVRILREKIVSLNNLEESVDDIITDIRDQREKESDEKMNLLLFILSVLSVVSTIDFFYRLFAEPPTPPSLSYYIVFAIGLFILFIFWLGYYKIKKIKADKKKAKFEKLGQKKS